MKLETKPREDHQVQIVAEFDLSTFEAYQKQAGKRIAKDTKIPGFRPGRAPFDVVRRYVGEDAIKREALDLLLDGEYPKIIQEAGISPGGPGTLEKILEDNPPKISLIVPLEPEVHLPDYRSVRKPYLEEAVEPSEVDEVIENLRKNQATAEPVDRPAKKGDQVAVNVSGEIISPAGMEKRDFLSNIPYQVIIGEDVSEDSWPFVGFSKKLSGLKINDEKIFEHKYPNDSSYKNLQGATVKFKISVQSVKSVTLPRLDDEFAQSTGEFENLAQLREEVSKQLSQRKKHDYENRYLSELIDQLVEEAEIKYPPILLEEQIEHTLTNLEGDLANHQMDMDAYLKSRSIEREDLVNNELKPMVIARIKRTLLLEEIAKAEDIQLSKEELQEAVGKTINDFFESGNTQPKNQLERTRLTNALAYETATRLVNQRLMERLIQIASGKMDNSANNTPGKSSAGNKVQSKKKRTETKNNKRLEMNENPDEIVHKE